MRANAGFIGSNTDPPQYVYPQIVWGVDGVESFKTIHCHQPELFTTFYTLSRWDNHRGNVCVDTGLICQSLWLIRFSRNGHDWL